MGVFVLYRMSVCHEALPEGSHLSGPNEPECVVINHGQPGTTVEAVEEEAVFSGQFLDFLLGHEARGLEVFAHSSPLGGITG